MAEVEAEDQASETLEPATEALEEQGDSSPAKLVVLPLMERLFGGAIIKEKKHIFKRGLLKHFEPYLWPWLLGCF